MKTWVYAGFDLFFYCFNTFTANVRVNKGYHVYINYALATIFAICYFQFLL